MTRNLSIRQGFTLIEIVIVIAIIAILSLGATVAYGKFTATARLNTSASAAKLLTDAINIKAAQNGTDASIVDYDPAGVNQSMVGPLVGSYSLVQVDDLVNGNSWSVGVNSPTSGRDYFCNIKTGKLAYITSCQLNP